MIEVKLQNEERAKRLEEFKEMEEKMQVAK